MVYTCRVLSVHLEISHGLSLLILMEAVNLHLESLTSMLEWHMEMSLSSTFLKPYSLCNLESRPEFNGSVSLHVKTKSVSVTSSVLVFTYTDLRWWYI